MLEISFSYLDIQKVVVFNNKIKGLISALIENEGKKPGIINYIFTSNQKILEINQTYLDHHYYTDVITFNENKRESIHGDIYISIEQIRLNAKKYKASFEDELLRVMIHGVLHLIGFNDQSESEKIVMREKEDAYLCKFRKFELLEK